MVALVPQVPLRPTGDRNLRPQYAHVLNSRRRRPSTSRGIWNWFGMNRLTSIRWNYPAFPYGIIPSNLLALQAAARVRRSHA